MGAEVEEEMDPSDGHVLDLFAYYESQLHLFAECCHERAYNCMHVLERQYPYDMLLCAVKSEWLPKSLRAAFCQLLCRLYIDCFPFEPLRTPRLVHVYDRLRDTSDPLDAVLFGGRQNEVAQQQGRR